MLTIKFTASICNRVIVMVTWPWRREQPQLYWSGPAMDDTKHYDDNNATHILHSSVHRAAFCKYCIELH